MNYSSELEGDVLILSLNGDLIGENNGPGIIEHLNDYINKGAKYCLIDISEVRYMNSSGLGVLITILTKLRNKDGDAFLLKPSEQVEKLLVITKLNNIFTIYNSKEEALSNIK